MEDAFYRQNSPFYNDTVVGIVSSNYPGVSNLREFQNINGLFDSPAILGTNDKQTGTGVIRSVLINYSPEAFPSIFSEAGPVVQSAGQAAFATYFNGRPFKIVVSRQDDLDFDLATLLRDYNEVMELDLVIPTSGRRRSSSSSGRSSQPGPVTSPAQGCSPSNPYSLLLKQSLSRLELPRNLNCSSLSTG